MNTNDVPFATTFPYVALPHSGSNTGPGGLGGAAASGGGIPSGGVATGAGGTAGGNSNNNSTPWIPISAGLAGAALAGFGVFMLRRQPATR